VLLQQTGNETAAGGCHQQTETGQLPAIDLDIDCEGEGQEGRNGSHKNISETTGIQRRSAIIVPYDARKVKTRVHQPRVVQTTDETW
jgi:hypothetical protein